MFRCSLVCKKQTDNHRQYTNVSLFKAPGKAPPPDWPQAGRIEFERVYMTYSINDPPVLKDLNFVVFPKEKVNTVIGGYEK